MPTSVYKNVRGKSNAALQELLAMRRLGRPVLVGTTSVESTEAFSEKLDELQVPHRVLNAKAEAAEREAEIIAQARPPSLAPRLSPGPFLPESSRATRSTRRSPYRPAGPPPSRSPPTWRAEGRISCWEGTPTSWRGSR